MSHIAIDFKIVQNKKQKYKNRLKKLSQTGFINNVVNTDDDTEYILKCLQYIREALDQSAFLRSFQKVLEKNVGIDENKQLVKEVVCYGIGKFSTCKIALHQLAFLISICKILKIKINYCYLYEPALSKCEELILQHLQIKQILFNEEGKHRSDVGTLYYMPHCGRPLYNNLLQHNWSPSFLSRTYILGNSFSAIIKNTPERIMINKYPSIFKVMSICEEHQLENIYHYTDIFNDTCLQLFPLSNIRLQQQSQILHNSESSNNKIIKHKNIQNVTPSKNIIEYTLNNNIISSSLTDNNNCSTLPIENVYSLQNTNGKNINTENDTTLNENIISSLISKTNIIEYTLNNNINSSSLTTDNNNCSTLPIQNGYSLQNTNSKNINTENDTTLNENIISSLIIKTNSSLNIEDRVLMNDEVKVPVKVENPLKNNIDNKFWEIPNNLDYDNDDEIILNKVINT